MISIKAYERIGFKALRMFKDIIFSKQKDVKGNKFKRYGKKYGERKRAGELPLQTPPTKTTRAPIVSGNFKNDFQFRKATKNGFRLGWASYGQIVKGLNKMGRQVTTKDDPFPKDVMHMIDRQLDLEIKKALGKTHKNITIKIGK
jgi:hypothetical protein